LLRISSAIWWIFCSVATRLASARAVRSAAWRSRHVGFRLVFAVFIDLENKPMILSFRSPGGAACRPPEGGYPVVAHLCQPGPSGRRGSSR